MTHFLESHERRGLRATSVTPRAMRVLQRYAWPGNVRELANTIERLMILSPHPTIEVEDLPENIRTPGPEPATDELALTLEDVERRHIERVLTFLRGNRTAAARRLGVDRNTLNRKLKQWEDLRERTSQTPQDSNR